MASLSLRHLGKTYDNGFRAIRDFNLDINDKEFMVLAGPVGCGVSTVLRMIAGLEEITDGELYIDGQMMNSVSSMDRDVAMIFKNGKLYPQMNVYDNLAFGLKLKGLPEEEISARIGETAELLGIGGLTERMTEELTEKERALVVLGRVIVKKPKVFLFDEPFASLSREVKKYMQELLWKLHEKLQTTIIYVTHNSEDALELGTRIAVMNDGTLQQTATAQELCENPATPYVSEFFGLTSEAVCQ